MKKIAIASGKGGVGKSMLSSSLSILLSKENDIVVVDCDVDAPNLAVWLGEPENWKKIEKISVSEKPIIKENKIGEEKAKECAKKCRFNALEIEEGKLKLNPFLCEGCGACEFFCPKGTVKMEPVKSGEIKIKETKYGFPIFSGHLYPGETGSGKIVSEIKTRAEKASKKKDFMLIDSAPGTGCPVIASLQDVDLVLLVTEPTPSAFSDLKRVLEVVNHFNIPWLGVINKWDINKSLSSEIENWFGEKMIGKISYDKNVFKAISNLNPIMETDLKAKEEIENIHSSLISMTS